jgi:sugar lactone lactonase YvrE
MTTARFFLVLRGLAVFGVAVIVTWLALPSPVGSLPWVPSPVPALDGPYAANELLRAARPHASGVLRGAADIAVDGGGRLWAGLDDRLVRVEGDRVVDVARPGRVTGLDVGPDGHVVVCVDERGLLRIDATSGAVTPLVTELEGDPLRTASDAVVASDGVIYFTVASTVWGPRQALEDVLDQRPTGRVLRFDPRSGETLVLAGDLAHADGIALAADERSLLVVESGRYQVWRLWLSGDRRNLKEVVLRNVPGFAAKVTRSPRGTFWVALSSGRKRLLDATHPYPFLKDALATLPEWARPSWVPIGFVVELDADGAPLRSLQDPEAVVVTGASVALEHGSALWLAGRQDPVARLPLP